MKKLSKIIQKWIKKVSINYEDLGQTYIWSDRSDLHIFTIHILSTELALVYYRGSGVK